MRIGARRSRPAALLVAVLLACVGGAHGEDDPYLRARERMVREQIASRGVEDPRVLAALARVPRHELVPAEFRDQAYEDRPLAIGRGQTISQPFVVAYMTEQLRLRGEERVLEVGTGSGYQAAVLAELAREVYTIEIVEELAERARQDLERLGYRNVHVRVGDGYRGWPEQAPFDAIIVTAAPDHVPQPLVEQLAVGGRLVLPVGSVDQELLRIERDATGIRTERLIDVRFVPMRGEAEQTE
jgi:protein-L-isoaspartate(D-aspartate) O-methyltransferase